MVPNTSAGFAGGELGGAEGRKDGAKGLWQPSTILILLSSELPSKLAAQAEQYHKKYVATVN